MSRLRNLMPIRVKIIGIVTLSLVASLGSIFVVASALIVEDKTSYVLDYSLVQVRSVAHAIEAQIEGLNLSLQVLDRDTSGGEETVRKRTEELAARYGVSRMLVLLAAQDGNLRIERAWNDREGTAAHLLDQLGWTLPRLRAEGTLAARSPDGKLAIGTYLKSPGPLSYERIYLTWLRVNPGFQEGEASVDVHVLDSSGALLFSSVLPESPLPGSRIQYLARPVFSSAFTSGVQTWSYRGRDLIAGYQRLRGQELWVFSVLPRDVAFSTVRGLLIRTLSVGVLILMIAIGVTLLTVKQVTEGLRQMAAVVAKMNGGSFQFRVDTRGMANDEIGLLASSFNAMAERIDELMSEATQKVERRHEAQVIDVVHNHILPERPFENANVQLFGATLSAKECGGDWWNYVKIGDYLVWVMGKVEGKGLAPAVISSAAHGAFSTFAETTRLTSGKTPDLKLLLGQINRAIFEAGRGKAQASCLLASFNSHSGSLEMMNAFHAHPFLHRIGFGGRPEHDSERYSRMQVERFAPLGRQETVEIKSQRFQLKPEDVMIFTSKGLTEQLDENGLFQEVAGLYDHYGVQPAKLAPGLIQKCKERWKLKEGEYPADDATVVVVGIPKKAYFLQTEAA